MTTHTTTSKSPHSAMGEDAIRHLAALIRIDTTNPPGNETPAAEYIANMLQSAGLDPQLMGAEPARQNVVARLRGDGSKPPLMLAAHLDVVPVERDKWTTIRSVARSTTAICGGAAPST